MVKKSWDSNPWQPHLASKWASFTTVMGKKVKITQKSRISGNFNNYIMKDHQIVSLKHPLQFTLGLLLSCKSKS